MLIDKFTKHEGCSVVTVYSLKDVKSKSLVKFLGEDGYLAMIDNENAVEFAVFCWHYNDNDDSMLTLQFHGKGFSGELRECRHTYWGDNGYIFYPNGKVISAAFKELSLYFDDMC